MKNIVFISCALLSASAASTVLAEENKFFYCGYTNLDGSGQDYSKWGKGTDFIFNKARERWEWNTEYTNQYIYPNGKYEQKTKVSFFEDQKGKCNKEMEAIYKRKIKELTK